MNRPRGSYTSRSTRWHACCSVLAFTALGLVAARAGKGHNEQLDQATISAISAKRRGRAISAARVASALAEPRMAAVPLAAVAAVCVARGGRSAVIMPSAWVASGVAARRLLCQAIARERPPRAVWLAKPEGFSLPSRHTSMAALTAGACASGLGAGPLARSGVPLLAAAGVGASRIYLGMHWPTDVLAGWLFAEGWLHLAEALRPARVSRSPGQ